MRDGGSIRFASLRFALLCFASLCFTVLVVVFVGQVYHKREEKLDDYDGFYGKWQKQFFKLMKSVPELVSGFTLGPFLS